MASETSCAYPTPSKDWRYTRGKPFIRTTLFHPNFPSCPKSMAPQKHKHSTTNLSFLLAATQLTAPLLSFPFSLYTCSRTTYLLDNIGKQIQFGNSVPFSKTKTRRTWLPNVQTKRLFSETLNDWVRLNMTTHVIRTVDKKGGLDRYLLETRPELLGEKGVELRGKIVEALQIKQAKKAFSRTSAQSSTLSPEASEAVKAVTAATESIKASSPTAIVL